MVVIIIINSKGVATMIDWIDTTEWFGFDSSLEQVRVECLLIGRQIIPGHALMAKRIPTRKEGSMGEMPHHRLLTNFVNHIHLRLIHSLN